MVPGASRVMAGDGGCGMIRDLPGGGRGIDVMAGLGGACSDATVTATPPTARVLELSEATRNGSLFGYQHRCWPS